MRCFLRKVVSLARESTLLQEARAEPDDLYEYFQLRLGHGPALSLVVALAGSVVEDCFPSLLLAVAYLLVEMESAASLPIQRL